MYMTCDMLLYVCVEEELTDQASWFAWLLLKRSFNQTEYLYIYITHSLNKKSG